MVFHLSIFISYFVKKKKKIEKKNREKNPCLAIILFLRASRAC